MTGRPAASRFVQSALTAGSLHGGMMYLRRITLCAAAAGALLAARVASAQMQLGSTAGPDRPPGDESDGAPGERRGRTFISPMGEPFRGGPDPAARWFAQADRDGNGRLTLAEFQADAARFFATLDLNHDAEIGPDEIDRYEQVIAPETASGGFGSRPSSGRGSSGGGRHGGHGSGRGSHGGGGMGAKPDAQQGAAGSGATEPQLQGAARYGYLALPEPVVAADANLDRAVSSSEFAQAAARRFALLDTNGDGAITPDELPKLAGGMGHRPGRRGPRP